MKKIAIALAVIVAFAALFAPAVGAKSKKKKKSDTMMSTKIYKAPKKFK
ncbi:MAG: hypothetical protein ACR2KQ_07730 [Actinomycetota bacterium]